MIKILRKLCVKHTAIATILFVIFIQILFHLDVWFFHVEVARDFFGLTQTLNEVMKRFICTGICFIFIIFVMKSKLADVGFTITNLGKGLIIGIGPLLIPLTISILPILSNIMQGAGHFAETREEYNNVIISIIECISVGLFEETAYRVVPINILRNKECKTDRGLMWYSLIISSVLFGLIHLSNIIGGFDTVPQGIARVIQASGAGIILGAIYWRTGSIIPSIILHFLWDAIGIVGESIYITSSEATNTNSISFIPMAVGMFLIYFLIALFILRKKKYEGCLIKAKVMREMV